MLFLLRSAFWLSLVFWALPDTAGGPAMSPQVLAQQAVTGIEGLCLQDPQNCLSVLGKSTDLVRSMAEPQARMADVPMPPTRPSSLASSISGPAPAERHQMTGKGGSLTQNDLIPAWHPPVAKM